MAETTPTKSKRDLTRERLANKYPDRNFDDEEELFGAINDDYDSYDNDLAGYREREQTLSDMFTSDPKSASFLTAWRKGGDPVTELIRIYGKDEIMDAINDPDRLEELSAANKDFVERVAKEKELDEQYQQNLAASLEEMGRIQEAQGLSDEDLDAAMEWLLGIVGDAVLGKFAPETIEMAIKALHHDTDVAEASATGEVRGRNANITDKLRKSQRGDGMPNMGGKNGSGAQKRRGSSIFSMAEEAL